MDHQFLADIMFGRIFGSRRPAYDYWMISSFATNPLYRDVLEASHELILCRSSKNEQRLQVMSRLLSDAQTNLVWIKHSHFGTGKLHKMCELTPDLFSRAQRIGLGGRVWWKDEEER